MVQEQTATEADPRLEEEGVWTRGPDGELIPDYDSTFPTINEGEVVSGTVVRVDKDEVLVDIGYKSEGVIPVSELSIRRSVDPASEVQLGDEIDALVLTKEDTEGRLILSKKRARFEMAWKKIERAAESGEPVEGTVIEVVKGGLILDLGVRGFLPASLVDIRRVQDLDDFLGKTLRSKVIELNRSRNNVVLSRRAVIEEERKEMRQAILDRLSPGDVVTGTISNIVDFGAFVDLDGIDGLIHISELSWSHVNHPSELLEIGQEVSVKVLDIDRDRQRISLGLKQTQTDPWQQVVDTHDQGDVIEGKVTKVVTFGAFVEILPGVEGLVHISELAQHHVENPREIVSQGDVVKAKIIEMDAERRRLSLSLKRVEEGDEGPTTASAESLGLSEEVFAEDLANAEEAPALEETTEPTQPEDSALTEETASEDAAPEDSAPAEAADEAVPLEDQDAGDEPEPEPPSSLRTTSRPRRSRPVSVAVTGGIGAGKSELLHAFERQGAAVVSSDDIVHILLRQDPDVKRAVVERLGEEVLGPDGEIDRGAVARIVFSSRRQLKWLEELLHPLVVATYLRWREQLAELDDPPEVCITEVPLLYEVGGETRFDKVVAVTASPDVRAARKVLVTDRREGRLIPDDEKLRRADFAYVNDGSREDLDAFAADVMARLTK